MHATKEKKVNECIESGRAKESGSNVICLNKELCPAQGARLGFARHFCNEDPKTNGKVQPKK